MSSALSIDFLEPTSEFQMPVTFLLVDKNTKCGYSISYFDLKESFGNYFVRICWNFHFLYFCSYGSVSADIAHYAR